MRIPNIRSKVVSDSCPTSSEPDSEPATTGMSTFNRRSESPMPLRRNWREAVAEEVMTPSLLEPFAVLPGTPASTSKGTVSSEAPPAIVLMIPAMIPPTSRTANCQTSNLGLPSRLENVRHPIPLGRRGEQREDRIESR